MREQNRKDKEYLKPKFLYELICECLDRKEVNKELYKSFELLVDNIMKKNYYANVQDKEDCRSGAILALLKGWVKFNPTKSTNAFSFLTACVKNGLIVTWNEIHPIKVRNNVHLGMLEDFESDDNLE